MQVTFDRKSLLAAFKSAASFAPSRSPKAILCSVKLEAFDGVASLSATDMEIGVRLTVPKAEVGTPGACMLPVERFSAILRDMRGDEVKLAIEAKALVVRGERSEFKLPTENPNDFPTLKAELPSVRYELLAADFCELIRRTVFATDEESTRYALGGVMLEPSGVTDSVIAVGCDGRRMAAAECQGKRIRGGEADGIDMAAILPARAARLIAASLAGVEGSILLGTATNEVIVHGPGIAFSSRQVEGRFPRWRDVFPQRDNAPTINFVAGSLLSSLRQAAVTTSEESRGVIFSLLPDNLVLNSRASDVGESHVEYPHATPYGGPPLTTTINPQYVQDFLKSVDGDAECSMELVDSDTAVIWRCGASFRYVTMPLSVG